MLIQDLLRASADRIPGRPLLVRGKARLDYGEADSGADGVSAALLDLGLAPGDRVAILSANTPFYIWAYFGVLRAGGIAVPLNAALPPASIPPLLDDCGARFLLAGEGFGKKAQAVATERPSLRGITADGDPPDGWLAMDDVDGTSGGHPRNADDPAVIIYTSGSTGRPRGATLSHANVVHNTRAIVRYLSLTADDVVLDVLPFHYVYGSSLLHTHVAVGGALVVEESLLFPDRVLDRIDEEGITGFSGVPSTFAILLSRSTLTSRRFPTLRYLTQAGGAMPPAHVDRLREALPEVDLFIMYGATEASARLSYLDPAELPRRRGSIGRALPGVTLSVVKEDGSLAAPGEVGEICAAGPNIMLGYWDDPEETARVMGPHGFRTGDLAKSDDDGFLYVVGRSRDMIKAGANRVSAKEVEEVLASHAAVAEAAVIGVPDEMLGEAIHAYVVLKPDADGDEEALRDHCRERTAPFKVPRSIELRKALPRTGSGKVDKEALRAEAG